MHLALWMNQSSVVERGLVAGSCLLHSLQTLEDKEAAEKGPQEQDFLAYVIEHLNEELDSLSSPVTEVLCNTQQGGSSCQTKGE